MQVKNLNKMLRINIKFAHTFVSSKLAAQFQSMEVVNSSFAAYIDMFTPNTYVMVILSDPTIRKF